MSPERRTPEELRPAGPAQPAGPDPALRRSLHRERFLGHNRNTRRDEDARALLASEWRYLGPLIAGQERPCVLDLACGSGPSALAWAERGGTVVGVDFDRGLLHAARERWRAAHSGTAHFSEPAWLAGDAVRLPLRDRSVDIVFCDSLLEHVPDWRGVLVEMSRTLRPGGIAVVYTTNRYCPVQQEVNGFPFYSWLPGAVQRRVLAWIMEHRRDLVNWTDFPAIHWFTFPRLRRAFQDVGLEPLDRVDLIARGGGEGVRGALASAMARRPALKIPYYLCAVSLAMYGVRR